MSVQIPDLVSAMGVAGDGANDWSSGGVVAHPGVGVFELTLDQAAAADEYALLVTLRGATGAVKETQVSTSVKKIETFAPDGVTPADKAFNFLVLRRPGGQG